LDGDLKLQTLLCVALPQLRASSHQRLSTQSPEAATKYLRCADDQRVQLAECLGTCLKGSVPGCQQNSKRLQRSSHTRDGQLVACQGLARRGDGHGLVESRVRGDAHARFGGRVEETGEVKPSYRASARPYFNLLESTELDAMVINARHIKAVPGRRTDVKDAEWIADLLRHGLLRACFIPRPPPA